MTKFGEQLTVINLTIRRRSLVRLAGHHDSKLAPRFAEARENVGHGAPEDFLVELRQFPPSGHLAVAQN